jgi:hypothetical protein
MVEVNAEGYKKLTHNKLLTATALSSKVTINCADKSCFTAAFIDKARKAVAAAKTNIFKAWRSI